VQTHTNLSLDNLSSERSLQLSSLRLQTPIGEMLAMASEDALYYLDFCERKNLESQQANFQKQTKAQIQPGTNKILSKLQQELSAYFEGSLEKFETPLALIGTEFQKQVLKSLQEIPYGQKITYKDQASSMNRPRAVRAVAKANGQNHLAIIIPCHRVVGSQGSLTGYSGGLERKRWLLNLEANQHETHQ